MLMRGTARAIAPPQEASSMSIWESVSETASGVWDTISSLSPGDIWGSSTAEEASRNPKDHGAEIRAQTKNQLKEDETKHLQGYEKTPLLAEYDKQQYQENLRKSAQQKNMN